MGEKDKPEGRAFISYVREDSYKADLLQRRLEAAGIRVWRDTADLWPGQDWRAEIHRAIRDDALVFLACFSHGSVSRGASYQNVELDLAVEQLRQRRPDVPWLIPVRFDDCAIPDRDIGGGRTLGSIQGADLFGDQLEGKAERLVTAILRILPQESDMDFGRAVSPETPQRETEVRLALRQEVGRLFAGIWSGTAVITLGTVDAGAPWLAWLVETANSSARPGISDAALVPDSAVLGIGAIDFAINARNRTAREIRHCIADRRGCQCPG